MLATSSLISFRKQVFEGNTHSTLNYYALIPFSNEIEFTCNLYKFKANNLVVLVLSQSYATSTTIKWHIIFNTPKGNLVSIISHSPSPPSSPSPWQPLIDFLTLGICLYCTFLPSRIMQYVLFCVWLFSLITMLSRFIHVIILTSISFFLMLIKIPFYRYIIFSLCINHIMAIWIISTFSLL